LFAPRILVALDTGRGVIYARASSWDRVYLLWTFRNFHSLPQKVLNPRQQQLIGRLYREAANHSAEQLYDLPVIGTVEDFNPSALPALPVSPQDRKFMPGPSRKKSPAPRTLGPSQPFYVRLASHRMTLRVGAGVVAAIIAMVAWHQLGAQPVSDRVSTQTVASGAFGDQPELVKNNLSPASVPASSKSVAELPSPVPIAKSTGAPSVRALATTAIAARPLAMASGTCVKRGSNVLAANARPENHRVIPAHHPASPATVNVASFDRPRIHIAGRPRKIVYPVCPETQARGKVSLKAVVGDDGAVNRVRVLTGDGVLAAAAVAAVRQWRYDPSSAAVQPLERETDITVSFISNEVVAVSFPNMGPISR
jgi:Gram-negative bacterial TonB protein C-terminal